MDETAATPVSEFMRGLCATCRTRPTQRSRLRELETGDHRTLRGYGEDVDHSIGDAEPALSFAVEKILHP